MAIDPTKDPLAFLLSVVENVRNPAELEQLRSAFDHALEKHGGKDVKRTLAAEAAKIVTGSRRSAYGTPERNFDRIAALWTAYLDMRMSTPSDSNTVPSRFIVEPRDVAAMMRLMKEARLIETPDHRDSFVDLVGYALCGAEVSGVQP